MPMPGICSPKIPPQKKVVLLVLFCLHCSWSLDSLLEFSASMDKSVSTAEELIFEAMHSQVSTHCNGSRQRVPIEEFI